MLHDYQRWQSEYLLRISRAMTSQLDLRAVLRLILASATELVGGQVGLIALMQPDGSYQVRAIYGLPPQMQSVFAPLLADIPSPGQYVDLLQWTIPDLERRLNQVVRGTGMPLRDIVALPMVGGDNLVGVIYVLRGEGAAFTAADRRMLSSFAAQAAIAVHNARLYEQVMREKQRLDAIIENSGDGVMLLDAEERITVFNRALTMMIGIPAEEAIGRRCSDALSLRDGYSEQEVRNLVCPAGRSQEDERFYVEGDFLRQDGEEVTLGITYSPLFDSEGELVNIIANVRDMTRFREAEEIKSTFISVISHELKTPVALIKGYASTLRRQDAQWDKETLDDSLGVIEEEADRLTELIDNLLDASRLQAGQLQLKKTDVHLDRLAARTVDKFRTQTDRHTFELDFAPGFPAVQGDQERLGQVINNLLSNAIKYSPEGGRIMVSGRYDEEQVYVAVSDQGIGIAPAERERIFDRFYRIDGALSRRTEGAGLGLYLVKSVVEAHGGEIWVASQPGKGSTFVFTLPRGG